MDFRTLRAQFSISTVIVLVVVSCGPKLLAGGWNNLGFIALLRVSQGLSLQGILRNEPAPAIDAEHLEQVYVYLERSEAVSASVSSAYGSGIAELVSGNYGDAASKLWAIWPQRSALVSLYSGYAFYKQGKTQEALLAWRAYPGVVLGLRQQARSLLSHGLVNDAINIFAWITEITPDSVQAWLDLSEGYANKGDWQQIANIAEEAAALEPDNLDVRILQAQVAFRLHRDVVTALDIMDDMLPRLQVIDSFEDEFRLYSAYVLLSQLTLSQGRTDDSIDWLKQAMALPRVGDRWAAVAIAQIYQVRGESEQALTWMNRALAGAPDDYSMYSALGYLLMSQGDLKGARDAFERAAMLAPDIVGPHNDLASLLANTGKTAEAEHEYRKALSIDSTNQVARNGLTALGVAP